MSPTLFHRRPELTSKDKDFLDRFRDDLEKLKGFIIRTLQKGSEPKQVETILLNAGWPPSIVRKYIDDALKDLLAIKKDIFLKGLAGKGETVLKLNKVCKSFYGNNVLFDVDLDISEGELFSIIGLSGSGKTTLLNTIIGFLQPDYGVIYFKSARTGNFHRMDKVSEEVKRTFGFASQEGSFYPKLTVVENMDYFGTLYGVPRKKRIQNIKSLLRLMDLEYAKDMIVNNISGGMQRRLGVACSLIHNPRILILDEPTADLDPIFRREMWDLIKKINKSGTTIIVASHFLRELENVSDRIGILHGGTIVRYGSPKQLIEMYSANEEVHLRTENKHYRVIMHELHKKNLGVVSCKIKDDVLVVMASKAEPIIHNIIHIAEKHNERITAVNLHRPNINEVFEHLVKEGNKDQKKEH